ncbi:MAG: hypothetical protein WBE37_04885 [Bryobacteraceae bacterium]
MARRQTRFFDGVLFRAETLVNLSAGGAPRSSLAVTSTSWASDPALGRV